MDIEKEWSRRKKLFFSLWPQNKTMEVEKIWEMLTRYYTEETRFYHTREHIIKCLAYYDQVEDKLQSSNAVQMSIWFHDVIYDVQARDNEEQSALFFSKLAKELLSTDFIELVTELIISTKHLSPPPNDDQAYLLDIDLTSFGSSLEDFYLNGDKLRKEVPHLTDQQYYDRVIGFFKTLLNRKQIFFTDYFYQKYELIARRNIHHQLKALSVSI